MHAYVVWYIQGSRKVSHFTAYSTILYVYQYTADGTMMEERHANPQEVIIWGRFTTAVTVTFIKNGVNSGVLYLFEC